MDDIQATSEQSTDPGLQARNWKRALWGFFLIALGAAFLLDRLGLTDLPSIRHLWPAVFFVIGASKLVEGRPGGAVTFVLMGIWFFACNEGWWGFEYENSWGLILVAIGAGMVIRVLSREDARRRPHRVGRGGVL